MNDLQPSLKAYRPVLFDDLIRVGKSYDGGYVMPRRAVLASRSVLSLGVNDDWSFEEAVLELNPGAKITCVDGTVSFSKILKRTLEKAGNMLGYLLLLKWAEVRRTAHYVATKAISFRRFFKQHELLRLMVSNTPGPGNISLMALLERVASVDGSCLLKCDIEGAEYDVFPGIAAHADRISAIVMEFHRLDVNWQKFSDCLTELSQSFVIAHLHGNNATGLIAGTKIPVTLEVTLIHRSLAAGASDFSDSHYPLAGLDMPCTPKRPDHPLSFD
jgi:hypothetical protein